LAAQDDTYHTYIRRSTRVPPSLSLCNRDVAKPLSAYSQKSVYDDVRYGKVRYMGALRTAHYALRPPQVRVELRDFRGLAPILSLGALTMAFHPPSSYKRIDN
jgi:hypothetical protein